MRLAYLTSCVLLSERTNFSPFLVSMERFSSKQQLITHTASGFIGMWRSRAQPALLGDGHVPRGRVATLSREQPVILLESISQLGHSTSPGTKLVKRLKEDLLPEVGAQDAKERSHMGAVSLEILERFLERARYPEKEPQGKVTNSPTRPPIHPFCPSWEHRFRFKNKMLPCA